MKTYAILAVLFLSGAANAQELTRQQMQEVRTACEADVMRLCSGIQPGGGRLLQCHQKNASVVSQICTAKLQEIKTMRQSN